MKLRYLIDLLLSPELKALTQVDKYAGMVRTIYQRVDNGTENSPIKRYPVACDVQNPECANTGVYDELIPDDKYKSLVYWEEVSPMKNNGYSSTQKNFYNKTFTGTARLVFWGNLAALGLEDCNGLFYALPDIEKILTKKGKVLTGEYEGFNYWIQPQAMVKQDINVVFGKYDYAKDVRYYLYPYDFFAIDVTFQLNQCLKKGGEFPILPSIDCPNNIGPTACERLLSLITPELRSDCVIPDLDFSIGNDVDFNSLLPSQKADLTTRLCSAGTNYRSVYSTRLVVSDYVGDCMQIRRGSDSTTIEIGFDVDGIIDTASIIAFCGASIGYVTKWYDQALMSDMGQSDSTKQPQIYDGSAIFTQGGFPSLRFDNAGGGFPVESLSSSFPISCDLTSDFVYFVAKQETELSGVASYWFSGRGYVSGNAGFGGYIGGTNTDIFCFGGNSNTIAEQGKTTKFDFKLSSVDATMIKRNGVDVGSYFLQQDMNGAFALSKIGSTILSEQLVPMDGYLCEIAVISLLASIDKDTDRQTIEDEIVSYYGL